MTHYARNYTPKGPDLKDPQGKQSDLVDRRAGAFDPVAKKPARPASEHAAAKPGADVRPAAEASDGGVPEGLRRAAKHPLNPSSGRGGVPPHVPDWKPDAEG
jgi:hypothetical protein